MIIDLFSPTSILVPFYRLSHSGILSSNIVRASRIVMFQITVPMLIFFVGVFVTPAMIGSSNMELLFMTQRICVFTAMTFTYKIGRQTQPSSQIITVSKEQSSIDQTPSPAPGSPQRIPFNAVTVPFNDIPTIDYSVSVFEDSRIE